MRRVAALALLGIVAGACMEVQVHVRVQADGSATMRLSYVVAQKLVKGEYVTFDRNELLPLDRPAIDAWVAAIAGARLLDVDIDDIDDATYQKYGGLRRIRFGVLVPDLEAVRFDHVRFAFYPWRNSQIFQFIVDKNIPKQEHPGRAVIGEVADLLRPALAGRALTLNVELPNRVSDSNANRVEWSKAEWRIPLERFLDTQTPRIVAWAVSDAKGNIDSWLKPVAYWLGGETWRSPMSFPDELFPKVSVVP